MNTQELFLCCSCKEKKPIECFPKDKNWDSGYRTNFCKHCMNEKQKERYRRGKAPRGWYLVYGVQNKLTGQMVYIGATTNTLQYRKQMHECHARSGKSNTEFARELIKTGFENFNWIELSITNDPKDEIRLMELYNTIEDGCNSRKSMNSWKDPR